LTLIEIDRAAEIPFHVQLRTILRRRLDSDFSAGEKLPSELELCETYGVSRTVVRQTLDRLSSDGLITKVKGVGAFANGRKLGTAFLQRVGGFHDEMASLGRRVTSRTLSQAVVSADAATALALNLPLNAPVICIDRLRSVNGDPAQVVLTTLPHARFEGLESIDLTDRSLYEILRIQYGCSPFSGRRSIECRIALPREAELLDISLDSAVIIMRSVSSDANGLPFEMWNATYRADMFKFEVELTSKPTD
jgi:GntR family transcriptional regulator